MIVSDCGHDGTHEFEEDYEGLVGFYLLSLCFGFVIEPLEHFGVLAGVDSEHPAIQKRAVLFSDCLILIFRVYVLEDLLGVEGVAVEVITFDPESGSEVVLVVGDVHRVLAIVLLLLFQVIIAADLDETPLVVAALVNLLGSELVDTDDRGGWSC